MGGMVLHRSGKTGGFIYFISDLHVISEDNIVVLVV